MTLKILAVLLTMLPVNALAQKNRAERKQMRAWSQEKDNFLKRRKEAPAHIRKLVDANKKSVLDMQKAMKPAPAGSGLKQKINPKMAQAMKRRATAMRKTK